MSLTEKVRALFLANPGRWIDGREIAQVGGYAGWRTRISDCRKDFAMQIENEYERRPNLTISRYRYTPETYKEA